MKGAALLIFIDGLGVGRRDPRLNACAWPGLRIFNRFLDAESAPLPFGGAWRGVDACLGVEGIPQSATGQTTFMTGENAPARLGHHLNGFPNAALREMLHRKSLLRDLRRQGKQVAFLNAYRPEWFVIGERLRQRFSSVTTVANLAAGLPFFGIQDIRERRSVYQEFTNRLLVRRGLDVPLFSPEEAGRVVAANAATYDFSLFEYFQTDRIGHKCSLPLAYAELLKLERFLLALLQHIDLAKSLVLVVSDHGNLEDSSRRGHTTNPAMVLAWGKHAGRVSLGMNSLLDVYPTVVNFA